MKSMTGFGKSIKISQNYQLEVVIKSVNSRYFDFKVNLPKELYNKELEIRNLIGEKIKRGKVDTKINLISLKSPSYEVNTNRLQALLDVYENIRSIVSPNSEIPIQQFLNDPDIIVETKMENDEELLMLLNQCVKDALSAHQKMALDEGSKMAKSICDSLSLIKAATLKITQSFPEYRASLKEKLTNSIKEFIENIDEDIEKKIVTELAFYMEKSDVNEEIVRLESHLKKIENLLNSNEPIGKSMNFILQEMHREVNTIGNKFTTTGLFNQVLIIKEEIEKMREMVQNAE